MEVLILVCGLWNKVWPGCLWVMILTILGMSLSDYFRGEGADESDETNDILDDFDGEEIDLMFYEFLNYENYGEEPRAFSVRGRMVKHRSSYLCTYLIKNLLFFSYISTETNNFTSRRPPGLCSASSYDGDTTEPNDWIFSKN